MEPTRERAYQRRIAELEAENADLKALVAELKADVTRLAELVAKLSRNSSNSSKPPSSDIVKPSKPVSSQKMVTVHGVESALALQKQRFEGRVVPVSSVFRCRPSRKPLFYRVLTP